MFLLVFVPGLLPAQMIDDGIMLSKHTLFAGDMFTHESWDHYWEGSLNRVNGNLGTVTTQINTWYGDFGITNRLNAIVQVPYVWTHASQGVLHDMQGFQDVTIAAKYAFLNRRVKRFGVLRAIAVGSGSIPLTHYTPDFEPLSIGTASKRISGRLTLNYQSNAGWFVNGTSAYTFRHDVMLDRGYYFTEDQLFFGNDVPLPRIFDYTASAGYLKRGLMAQFSFSQQRTQGGGDIRRQDMPFVSNRVNFSKVGGLLMYPLPIPRLRAVNLMFSYARIVDGRNIGESNAFTLGLFYNVHFGERTNP